MHTYTLHRGRLCLRVGACPARGPICRLQNAVHISSGPRDPRAMYIGENLIPDAGADRMRESLRRPHPQDQKSGAPPRRCKCTSCVRSAVYIQYGTMCLCSRKRTNSRAMVCVCACSNFRLPSPPENLVREGLWRTVYYFRRYSRKVAPVIFSRKFTRIYVHS